MQKIYTGLDEPDGLKGIATLRASNTLRDHIVDLENSGKWRDAFMCYDQVHLCTSAALGDCTPNACDLIRRCKSTRKRTSRTRSDASTAC